MDDLIEVLQILRKYSDTKYPTHCEHDELRIYVDPTLVSKEDTRRLAELSFDPEDGMDCFYSFRFGSC